jgi:hypothetical protein
MTKQAKQQLRAEYKKLYVKGWDELWIKLKQHGGEMISPQREPEDAVEWMISDGRIFDTTRIKFQIGKIGGCHENSARIWVASEELQLVRGYALGGGLWHQHSWLWNPVTGELIETTMQHDKYFGTILEGDQNPMFICSMFREIDANFKNMNSLECTEVCRNFKRFLREKKFPVLAIDAGDASQMISFNSIEAIRTIGFAGKPPMQTNRFVNHDHFLAGLSTKYKIELRCKDGTSRVIEHGNLIKE